MSAPGRLPLASSQPAAVEMVDTHGEDDTQEDATKQPHDILAELIRMKSVVNIADDLSAAELSEIGERCYREAEIDEDSRQEWLLRTEAGTKLAIEQPAAKSWPWMNAANIRYPLMTSAAIQFGARAYPAIISGTQVVKAQITGEDPGGEKQARGDRIAAHMSWQCLTEMPEWEPDVDRMLHNLPIVGCCFKKTYFSPELGRSRSDLVLAKNLIVNMAAASLHVAPRITHEIELYPFQMEERFRTGIYRRFEYQDAPDSDGDKDALQAFYEQHRRLDLDKDGYAEPYIVTLHKETRQIARIRANYDEDTIRVNKATGGIIGVDPVEYFTKIPFIPNPDGGFYDIGFAWLLSPMNQAIDTVINQLLDAGTLANTGGGFIGSQLRLKGGTIRFQPGQFTEVDVPGGVVKDNIVPLTFPGPSPVLFQLLGMLVESGREIASVKDVLTGQEPKGNVPATTTIAMIEQGLKVFTAIYKRIHRALKDEYAKLYRLNRKYFDADMYATYQDAPELAANDYEGDPTDIIPVSDPTMVSDMQKMARAQFLQGFLGKGLNDQEILRRLFSAAGIENSPAILNAPQQGPNPMMIAQMMKLKSEIEKNNASADMSRATAMKLVAEAELLEPAQRAEIYRMILDGLATHAQLTQDGQQADQQHDREVVGMGLQHQQEAGRQDLQQQALDKPPEPAASAA